MTEQTDSSPPLLLRYKSFTLNVDDIPDAMFLKLLQAGFTKRMHDAASGMFGKLTEQGLEADAARAVIKDIHADALEDILEGRWGQAKPKPKAKADACEQAIELMMVKVAKEALRANAKARGDKAPKGQAMLEHVQTLLQTSDSYLRAEAERRLAVTKELG